MRRDAVVVARKGEAPLSQIARDFGASKPCLDRWLKFADVDDGVRPGVTGSESAEQALGFRTQAGYRLIADELPARGIIAGENKVERLSPQ